MWKSIARDVGVGVTVFVTSYAVIATAKYVYCKATNRGAMLTPPQTNGAT